MTSPPSTSNKQLIVPVSGAVVSSGFGWRWGRPHKGTDFAVPTGTPVLAAADGKVDFASDADGYGLVVYLSHENGSSTRYAHNSKLLVKAGDEVKQGQVIALSGSSGRSTGPHLHWEVRLPDGTAVDPLKVVSGQISLSSTDRKHN